MFDLEDEPCLEENPRSALAPDGDFDVALRVVGDLLIRFARVDDELDELERFLYELFRSVFLELLLLLELLRFDFDFDLLAAVADWAKIKLPATIIMNVSRQVFVVVARVLDIENSPQGR